jgi:hypothetical protein
MRPHAVCRGGVNGVGSTATTCAVVATTAQVVAVISEALALGDTPIA